MKKTLTSDSMLDLWRLLRAAEPLRLDCTVERTDGVDLDSILRSQMRSWYLQLLDGGDERFLAPEDVAAQARVESADGLTVVSAPPQVRRVLRLQFSDWDSPIAPLAPEQTVRARAANRFSRRPLAARVSPRVIIVSGTSGTLSSLICAVDPGEDSYVFDDAALSRLIIDS